MGLSGLDCGGTHHVLEGLKRDVEVPDAWVHALKGSIGKTVWEQAEFNPGKTPSWIAIAP